MMNFCFGFRCLLTMPKHLMFKAFKLKGTLKELDNYKTKIELASSIITELIEFGLILI
jgi:hypothetical protein